MEYNPKIHAIGIVTAEVERSLDFYSTLGLATPAYDPKEDHFDCPLGNGVSLMWDTIDMMKQFLPDYKHVEGGTIGLGFDCGAPEEVDKVYKRLVDAGSESVAAPWDAFWGQRFAIVKDPDGNAVSVYATLG